MKLANWFKDKEQDLPLLGIESFKTFIEVCNNFAKWALDDVSMSTQFDKYKIWTCPVLAKDIKKVKDVVERYTSMKKLLWYYNNVIVENKPIIFYMSLDFINNKWNFEYGISNGFKLFKVGEFEYTIDTKLPEHEIVKYVSVELDDFNIREHLLLYKIRKDFTTFNPGYCQIMSPVISDKTVILKTQNLGQWHNNKPAYGEKERLLEIFKEWAINYKWSNSVILIIRPSYSNSIDFIIKLN